MHPLATFSVFVFSDASLNLYKSVCPSIRPSVRPSVHPSVCHAFVKKCMKLTVLCTEMIKKAYKVMNNIETVL